MNRFVTAAFSSLLPANTPSGHTRPVPAILAAVLMMGLTLCLPVASAGANDHFIIVQSTTSTQNSGFYRHVTPEFTAQTGIEVRVIAVGTGQALKNARNCDGDLLIVHAREDELAFVAAGHGLWRRDLMYNDFVIVGPSDDPAGLADAPDIGTALRNIAASNQPFASRGDASGTHRKERALWQVIGLTPTAGRDRWYRETGNGMGATLNYAVQSKSYSLTDRATWLAFGNRFDHKILFEGDPALFNQYGIVAPNPDRCPNLRKTEADMFADWLVSPAGQTRIASLTKQGQQLFFPNAAEATKTD